MLAYHGGLGNVSCRAPWNLEQIRRPLPPLV